MSLDLRPNLSPDDYQERSIIKHTRVIHVFRCMAIFDEKRYASACVEPPVPKCYLGQLDAQNDVLVLENLGQSGFRKYSHGSHLSDLDHCRVVLRRLAHFHALSMLIQRDAEQVGSLTWIFPNNESAFSQ